MDGSQVIAFARRLGAFVAGRLREGIARKVQRPSLAMARVPAVLVVALILAVALALRLIVMWGPAGGATTVKAADPPVVIFKDPNSANLWLCDEAVGTCAGEGEGELTVSERVAGIPSDVHIGSFEFVVYFSGHVVNVAVTEGPFLSSTGPTECWQEQDENFLRFGCRSTGSEPGPTGSGILAYLTVTPKITFRATRGNGVYVNLIDSRSEVRLSDDSGNPVPVDEVGNSTILMRALEGDVNYDCRVDVIDDQSVSGRYGLILGLLEYEMLYDLEPSILDYDIDIKDLQFVFGRNWNTCEGPPTPEVTPTPTPETETPTPPTPTSTPGSATPTRTPTTPHHKHTPTASPIPGGTSTPAASATPLPTPSAVDTVSPSGRTPGPGTTTSPAEVTPSTAEGLPPSGTGAGADPLGGEGWLLAIAAALAVLGWTAITGALYLGSGGLARSMSEKVRSRTRR